MLFCLRVAYIVLISDSGFQIGNRSRAVLHFFVAGLQFAFEGPEGQTYSKILLLDPKCSFHELK